MNSDYYRGRLCTISVYVSIASDYFDSSVRIEVNLDVYSDRAWCKYKTKEYLICNQTDNQELFRKALSETHRDDITRLVYAYARESKERQDNDTAVQCTDD